MNLLVKLYEYDWIYIGNFSCNVFFLCFFLRRDKQGKVVSIMRKRKADKQRRKKIVKARQEKERLTHKGRETIDTNKGERNKTDKQRKKEIS